MKLYPMELSESPNKTKSKYIYLAKWWILGTNSWDTALVTGCWDTKFALHRLALSPKILLLPADRRVRWIILSKSRSVDTEAV